MTLDHDTYFYTHANCGGALSVTTADPETYVCGFCRREIKDENKTVRFRRGFGMFSQTKCSVGMNGAIQCDTQV